MCVCVCVLSAMMQAVLEFNFQSPIQLSGRRVVQLPAQHSNRPLPLRQWMQQQQHSSSSSSSNGSIRISSCDTCDAQAAAPTLAGVGGGGVGGPVDRRQLLVVSWFEADCGQGGVLSTAPGHTALGHWQQSVEFVGSSISSSLQQQQQHQQQRCQECSGGDDGTSSAGGSVDDTGTRSSCVGGGYSKADKGATGSSSISSRFALQVSWQHDRVSFELL